MRAGRTRFAVLTGFVLSLAGCQPGSLDQQRTDRLPGRAQPAPYAFYQTSNEPTAVPASLVVRPDYRLNVGDQIEIMYSVRIQDDSLEEIRPARIEKFDVLTIRFFLPDQENFSSKDLKVGGDGRVWLPMIGEVMAQNKTVAELSRELRERFSQYMKDPQFVIEVDPKNQVLSDLIDAIKTSPRGSSRLVPVRPDGKISAILIPEVQAAGMTVAELQWELNNAYRAIGLTRIAVTVQLLELAPQKIYIEGEVARPGQILAGYDLTLLQAVSLAGGFTPRSDMSKVILIRRKGLAVPEGMFIDVNRIRDARTRLPDGTEVPDFAMYRFDVFLTDGDIIWVPPTGLARFNDWVDQVFTKGIRAIVPYSFNFGVNWTGYMGEQQTATRSRGDRSPVPLNVNVGNN